MQSNTFIPYYEYLQTPRWIELKQKIIYQNPRARCCICDLSIKRYLTLHHEIYRLGYERLNRDVFIVCPWCHERIHFVLFNRAKLPTIPFILRKRRQLLRLGYCLTKKNKLDILYSISEIFFL